MSMTGRGSRGRGGSSLAPRAVRMRNACVCIAADRLGLEPPTDADLRSLGDETSLRDAVEWWQSRADDATGAEDGPVSRSAGGSLVLRAAVVTVATVVGLALSYGRAQ